jgi:Endonuclease/Exonuclease/phosphatase family
LRFDSVRGMLGVIKGMGFSEITSRDRQERITLINAHTHPKSQAIRLAQLAQLTREFAQKISPSMPMVLTGDLNFTPSSLEYLFLKNVLLVEDAYSSTHGGYAGDDCTYCANNPHHWGGGDRVIDYILTRSASSAEVRAVKSVINLRGSHGITPSDHYGVQAGLAITDRAPAEVAPDEFRTRATRAIIAIDQALRILDDESDRRSDLDSSIRYLREIRSGIVTNNRLDPIVSNLWIP